VDFETYLQSKKIDSEAFRKAEPQLWQSWKVEFELLHPSSFTARNLFLINPIRRLYQLKVSEKPVVTPIASDNPANKVVIKTEAAAAPDRPSNPEAPKPVAKPPIPRPVFKPRPKTN